MFNQRIDCLYQISDCRKSTLTPEQIFYLYFYAFLAVGNTLNLKICFCLLLLNETFQFVRRQNFIINVSFFVCIAQLILHNLLNGSQNCNLMLTVLYLNSALESVSFFIANAFYEFLKQVKLILRVLGLVNDMLFQLIIMTFLSRLEMKFFDLLLTRHLFELNCQVNNFIF